MIPAELKDHPDARALEAYDPSAVEGGKLDRGELTLEVPREKIVPVCEFLKTHCHYNLLADVTATDWYPVEPRFRVVYHLYSLKSFQLLRLKVRLDGADPRVESVCSVWPTANWFEREVYDLFGVFFTGHPDLLRILMPEDWEGHPLRKDYPVEGFR